MIGWHYPVQIKGIKKLTLSAVPSTHHDPLLRIIIHSTESRLVGRFNQSFATWGNSGIEPDKGTGNQLSKNGWGQFHVASQ